MEAAEQTRTHVAAEAAAQQERLAHEDRQKRVEALTAAYSEIAALQEQLEQFKCEATGHDVSTQTTIPELAETSGIESQRVVVPDVEKLVAAVAERCELNYFRPQMNKSDMLETSNATMRRQIKLLQHQLQQSSLALKQARLTAEQACARQHAAEAAALTCSQEMAVLLGRERKTCSRLQQSLLKSQVSTISPAVSPTSGVVGPLAQQLVDCNAVVDRLTSANADMRQELALLRNGAHVHAETLKELTLAKETIVALRAQCDVRPAATSTPLSTNHVKNVSTGPFCRPTLGSDQIGRVDEIVKETVGELRRSAHSLLSSLNTDDPGDLSNELGPLRSQRRVMSRVREYSDMRDTAHQSEVIIAVLTKLLTQFTQEVSALRAQIAVAAQCGPDVGHDETVTDTNMGNQDLDSVRDLLSHCQLDLEMSRAREKAAHSLVSELREKIAQSRPLDQNLERAEGVSQILQFHDVLSDVLMINRLCVPRLLIGTHIFGVRSGCLTSETKASPSVETPLWQESTDTVHLHERMATAEKTASSLRDQVQQLMTNNAALQQKLQNAHSVWSKREATHTTTAEVQTTKPQYSIASSQTHRVYVLSSREWRTQEEKNLHGATERAQLERDIRQAKKALASEREARSELQQDCARQRRSHQAEVDRLRSLCTSLKTKLAETSSEFERIQLTSDRLQSQVDQLETRRKSDNALIIGLRGRLDKAEIEAQASDSHAQKALALETSLQKASRHRKSQASQLETTRKELASAQHEISVLESDLLRETQARTRLQKDLDRAKSKNRSLTTTTNELQARLRESTSRVDVLEGEREKYEQSLENVTSRACQTAHVIDETPTPIHTRPTPSLPRNLQPRDTTFLTTAEEIVPDHISGNVQRILNITDRELDDLMSSLAVDDSTA